jgi:hypothetical protein
VQQLVVWHFGRQSFGIFGRRHFGRHSLKRGLQHETGSQQGEACGAQVGPHETGAAHDGAQGAAHVGAAGAQQLGSGAQQLFFQKAFASLVQANDTIKAAARLIHFILGYSSGEPSGIRSGTWGDRRSRLGQLARAGQTSAASTANHHFAFGNHTTCFVSRTRRPLSEISRSPPRPRSRAGCSDCKSRSGAP